MGGGEGSVCRGGRGELDKGMGVRVGGWVGVEAQEGITDRQLTGRKVVVVTKRM